MKSLAPRRIIDADVRAFVLMRQGERERERLNPCVIQMDYYTYHITNESYYQLLALYTTETVANNNIIFLKANLR